MGSILGAVGSVLGGPLGGIAGTLIGGLVGGGGGGGGGSAPSQPQLPGGINPNALAASIASLPSQQAATAASQQEATLLNQMGTNYNNLYGSIPITQDVTSGLANLFNPAGNVPATNYQIGQLQSGALSESTAMRNALAARGITGPMAEAVISQGVTEPEMMGEANIRALAMNDATKNMTTGLDWLKGFMPTATGLMGAESTFAADQAKAAQAAAAPFLNLATTQGQQAGYAPPGSVAGAQAGAPGGAPGGGLPTTPPGTGSTGTYPWSPDAAQPQPGYNIPAYDVGTPTFDPNTMNMILGGMGPTGQGTIY